MLFNSFGFIFVFLPAALLGYYCLGLFKHRIAAVWLCIASLVFYGWWNSALLAILVGSAVFNYSVGLSLLALASTPWWQTAVLVGGISANLGLLFYFKYLFPL